MQNLYTDASSPSAGTIIRLASTPELMHSIMGFLIHEECMQICPNPVMVVPEYMQTFNLNVPVITCFQTTNAVRVLVMSVKQTLV